ESPAVKAGLNLVKVLREVEVEAEATHIPHEVSVDISLLTEVGQEITAGSLALPTGVTLVTKADEVVAIIAEATKEEETPVAAIDMSAIGDAVKRGKEDEAAPAPAPQEGAA